MMKLNREEIIKALECCSGTTCKTICPLSSVSEINCGQLLINESLALIKELTLELEAMRCAANSYRMHYEKLSEEILNAFERGQKQATAHTVGKMRDRLRNIDEFYKYSDVRGGLYYLDLQTWVTEIEVDILEENK